MYLHTYGRYCLYFLSDIRFSSDNGFRRPVNEASHGPDASFQYETSHFYSRRDAVTPEGGSYEVILFAYFTLSRIRSDVNERY